MQRSARRAECDYSSGASGLSIAGGTLYCTNQPCVICAKMIINAGIERIVIRDGYPDELAQDMLQEAGLNVELLER